MLRSVGPLLLLGGGCCALQEGYVRANGPLLWEGFKREHRRSYAAAEEARRYDVFMANMLDAARLEAADPGASFGASKFADLTADEFKTYHSLRVPPSAGPPPLFSVDQVRRTLATSVDWRTSGAVTQVKDQAQCGSCWSFSTTGGIEGQWFLAGHNLTSVSEQNLVSCDKIDDGCNGGLMDNAFQWLMNKQGGVIVTEESYPYTSGGGSVAKCKDVTALSPGAFITGHHDIPHDEDQMATWVLANGPLSIAVDASKGWQTYTGGVVSTCTGKSLDHGVLIVGVTPDYWIVKNSWGPSWGESGFIRLARGSNQCLLKNSPSTSTSGKGPAPPVPTVAPTPAPPPPPQCDTCECPAGSYCSPAKGVCERPSGKGCAAAGDAACGAGETCSPLTQLCVTEGGKCPPASACGTTQVCSPEQPFAHHCLTPTHPGALCAKDMDCAGSSEVCSPLLHLCVTLGDKCDPGPAPPPAPGPPAPPPATCFTQTTYNSSACSGGGDAESTPLGTCVQLTGGGSAIFETCDDSGMSVKVWKVNAKCKGLLPPSTASQPVGQCLQAQDGTSFENVCGCPGRAPRATAARLV